MIYVYFIIKEAVCEYRLFFLLYVGAPDNVTQIARKLSTEHTEDTEIFVEDYFKIFVRMSSVSDAIPIKILPRRNVLLRILVKDFS